MNQTTIISKDKILNFLDQFSVRNEKFTGNNKPLTGEFALLPDQQKRDLYGMIDAVYILYTIGELENLSNEDSRSQWAEKILACQDEDGWFTKENLRGHPKEHATAYALGALKLLEITEKEKHIEKIKPVNGIKTLLRDHDSFSRWICSLDFRLNIRSIARKNLGWHYIWRGSHVGGGVAAIIGMADRLISDWWENQTTSVSDWFSWYFDWLNQTINPNTGLWQMAFWNSVYKIATVMEMGGAVHFYWIYSRMNQPYPFPRQLIETVISLQRTDGLYKDHPYCIDLDANFCIIRAFLQLSSEQQSTIITSVHQSINKNYEQIVHTFTQTPLKKIYKDSHGLPGALAALVECDKLPGFKYSGDLAGWKHPLEKVWWL